MVRPHDDAGAGPLIVELGGTFRANSSSESALRRCLAHAQCAGARTGIFSGDDLRLPLYEPGASNDSLACSSMKSFVPKDGSGEPPGDGRNGEVDFRGQHRRNETHASKTDPDARLYKKAVGQAARLCRMGHALSKNRNGLVVDVALTQATGTAEREAACAMVAALAGGPAMTLGADKNDDTADVVAEMRPLGVTPHVAQNNKNRRSAIDGRTTRHEGYAISQRKRKRTWRCSAG